MKVVGKIYSAVDAEMKLFKLFVEPNKYGGFDYDSYDSIIIAAESEEQARNLLHNEDFLIKQLDTCYIRWSGNTEVQFKEIKISEITVPEIICASFNAG